MTELIAALLVLVVVAAAVFVVFAMMRGFFDSMQARRQRLAGRHEVDVESLRFVRTEPELAGLIARATRAGRCVRVAGAGHSHQPLVPTCDLIVDLSALSGVISVDVARSSARVRAGTPIYALGPALHSAGLALANQGDIDRQFIGGQIAAESQGLPGASGQAPKGQVW